jgi:hypothetical protein
MSPAASWSDAVALLRRLAASAASEGRQALADGYAASAKVLEEREALRRGLTSRNTVKIAFTGLFADGGETTDVTHARPA